MEPRVIALNAFLTWLEQAMPDLFNDAMGRIRGAADIRNEGLGQWESILSAVMGAVSAAAGTYLNYRNYRDQHELLQANLERLKNGDMPVTEAYGATPGAPAPVVPALASSLSSPLVLGGLALLVVVLFLKK